MLPGMTSHAQDSAAALHRIQQAAKWTIYALLIVNFGFYIAEDWSRAMHTLDAGAGLLDWTAEFATTIDESAWFLLLFMFELETYVLEDEDWSGWTEKLVHGVRILCYLMIAHTVYAYAVTALDLRPTLAVEGVDSLCELTDADVSYVDNLEYTAVEPRNCSDLTDATAFYWLGENPLVTDAAGLALERELAWVDLVEAVAWLLIVLAFEARIRLQNAGITAGASYSSAHAVLLGGFVVLLAVAAYWGALGHWLYVWDELVWIAGFGAIEMNLSDWRDELLEGSAATG